MCGEREKKKRIMKILLATPPMTQLNTPYPATAYLTGFLRSRGYETVQADPALELMLRLFSASGLQKVAHLLEQRLMGQGPDPDHQALATAPSSPAIAFFLTHQEFYVSRVEPVIQFLQGKDPSLALRIISRDFLPEGPRFVALEEGAEADDPDPLAWAFGSLGIQDRAKYLATLFLDDLADVIQQGIDERFAFSRYGAKLAASQASFEPLAQALATCLSAPTLVDELLQEITLELWHEHQPEVVGLTVPFPGNVYGAFSMAQTLKKVAPHVTLILGGGYVNTELRGLQEPRVFDFFDYLVLDDGERPLLCLLDFLAKKNQLSQTQQSVEFLPENLLRTFWRKGDQVVLQSDSSEHDLPQSQTGTPTYDGLKLDRYVAVFEMLNPMHRIWSDGRWNKLTLAHGCYWKKCSFCDVSLDYIGRYDPAPIDRIIDRMLSLIAETSQRGFHFVDEAAPPALLKALATRLLERQVVITWWGNIRFDRLFAQSGVASLLAQSGCVAVSGGLEVASDRLLKLMQKGVTVSQVAQVSAALSQAGIMVHAYLMYGFPTQTTQETLDALERVRQLFAAGCLQSGYWHRFSATLHSPIGRNPEKYGIECQTTPPESAFPLFAQNDLTFFDPTPTDHDFLGVGLKKALYNYMHGVGLDLDVRVWFGKKGKQFKVPKPQVPADLIASCLDPDLHG